MRQFSSGMKMNDLIGSFRDVPADLRSHISHLVTDTIYWVNEGTHKSYLLSNTVTLKAEKQTEGFLITFYKDGTSVHTTTLKKWPDNWQDEDHGRDKMKM